MRPCLHKEGEVADVTTWGDFAKYYAVLTCIHCGGRRLIHWEDNRIWPRNT